MKISAGFLLYRFKEGRPEVFLVHPGGPFYKNKEDGVWNFPKGEAEEGEADLLSVAKREFEEETGQKPVGDFEYLGSVARTGKRVELWMFEGDIDPSKLKSNTIFIDWPPRSGQKMEIPEVDRGEFFSLEEAKKKLWPYLVPFIEMFEKTLEQ